jgi:histidinol-phosphate aminotransferase
MRIGWAVGQSATIKQIARYKMPYNVSVFGVSAALAAVADPAHIDAERKRNTDVRAFTVKVLDELGCKGTDSQGNFLFVNVGRPASTFREACAKEGVMVGRDFPPFESTHARISIGTMDEMRRAADVFRAALRPVTTAGRER